MEVIQVLFLVLALSAIKLKSEALMLNSTVGTSKHKSCINEVEFVAKCPCGEIDYFFKEVEENFAYATKMAKKASRTDMKYELLEAKTYAIKSSAMLDYD